MWRSYRAGAFVCPLPIIIAFLLFLTACGQTQGTSALNASGASAGIYNNPAESPIFAMIEGARKTIDIEIYEIGDPDVRKALIDATHRDVKVQIVIEPKPVGVSCDVTASNGQEDETCKVRRDALRELTDADITVKPFSKELCGVPGKQCFQHGKLLIADGEKAMVSTGNFNSSSLCNAAANPSKCNRDFSIVVTDAPSVKALHKVFKEDFEGKAYDLPKILTPAVRKNVTVSPHALPDIVKFIKRAKTSVAVQAQYLKEPETNAALVAAAKSGVKVEVTLASLCSFTTRLNDKSQANLRETYQPFVDAGIDLKFFTKLNEVEGRPGYMHSKLIIIDDEELWVGSINGSTTSFLQNREFGVFSSQKAAVSKANRIFEQDHESEHNETLEKNLLCEKEANLKASADEEEDEG